MTVGMPSPPLRIIAPRGAPIKKKMRHASERVNFLCHSRQWRRISLLVSPVNIPRPSHSIWFEAVVILHVWRAVCICSAVALAMISSKVPWFFPLRRLATAAESLFWMARKDRKRVSAICLFSRLRLSMTRFMESTLTAISRRSFVSGISRSMAASIRLKLLSKSMMRCL